MGLRDSVSDAPISPLGRQTSPRPGRLPVALQRQRRDDSDETLSHNVSQSRSAASGSQHRRWWRIKLLKGLVSDIRRRAPYYGSDWRDAWDYRVIPATVYMYFVNLNLFKRYPVTGNDKAY